MLHSTIIIDVCVVIRTAFIKATLVGFDLRLYVNLGGRSIVMVHSAGFPDGEFACDVFGQICHI